MFNLPPLPPYDALHPLVVHFPIALLLITPLLLLLGLFMFRDRRPWALATLLVLLLGTAGAWLAASTGEAGEEAAEQVSAAEAVFEAHEDGAELVLNGFILITVLYAAFGLVLFKAGERFAHKPYVAVQLLFIVLCGAGSLAVANVGHLGGRLVHEYGVRAPIAAAAVQGGVSVKATDGGYEDYDKDDD